MLDPDTLRTFLCIAETGNFSRAAKKLFKTTATISYRIKLLEDNVGVPLLVRTTRSVSLTPAGRHLLSQAKEWLGWIDGMQGELRQINDGVERQVNIVVNNLMYSPQAIATLLAWLTERYPFTQFHFSRQIYMGVWDTLLHDDFSLAIGVTGNESLSDSVALAPLGEVNWLFVMAPHHPLNQQSLPLSDAQLRRYPVVNIKDSAVKLTRRVAWLLPGQKEIVVPDMETKIAAHLAGVGVGFLPEPLCRPLIEAGLLVNRSIPVMRPPSPLSLAWQKGNAGKAVQDIVALFVQRKTEVEGFWQPFSSSLQ